ncbi:MAG: hypothetical protein ACI4S9_02295, partial [Christensenellales bacterium]
LRDTVAQRVGKKSTRSVAFACAGCIGNAFVGVGKLAASIVAVSFFALSNALYTFAMLGAKIIALAGIIREHDVARQYKYYKWSGIVLLLASVFYITYSVFEFMHPSFNEYNIIVAITIATFTFLEIGLNIRGIVIERRNRTPLVHGIKIINFAASLITLVLTQSALLSIGETPIPDSSFNGLLGIITGGCAVALGIFMIVHIEQMRQGKDYFQYFFELEKLINEHNLSVRLKPVKIVGEYEKILYVKLVGDEKGEWPFVRDLAAEKLDFSVETVN